MRTLLDTNVLARIIQKSHPQHEAARRSVRILRARDGELCIVPQVLYELWVVCTKPAGSNGIGLSIASTRAEMASILRFTTLFRDERAIFEHWDRLVATHDVKGKSAHDARLVAAMLRHKLTHILTFNTGDFRRYPEIEVLTPATIVSDASRG
ncbi:MAG: tRNA(fMet)-specific endonuclease VapC [Phycisphaerae bacterium]|nr:tRNA(fMet)-specific endonuclease VapC [Phycisphaerae bacterium]